MVLYFPAVQREQPSEPGAALYLPGWQAKQVPPFKPTYPALHVQDRIEGLDSWECEYAGQFRQEESEAAAIVALYFPDGHPWQAATTPPIVLYLPAKHAVQVTVPKGPTFKESDQLF